MPKAYFTPAGISQIPKGIYFVEKKHLQCKCFFHGRGRGTWSRLPARSVLLHPLTRFVPNIQSVLSKQKVKSFASLTVK